MNTRRYKELKKKADDRYQKAVEAAKQRHIEELRAIETVWRMEHPSRKNSSEQFNENLHKSDSDWGAIAAAVKNSLKYVPEIFTKTDIRTAMKQIAPEIESKCRESSLTSRLLRLVDAGEIEKLKTGKGSAPNKYRLKTSVAHVTHIEINTEDKE
ncbi:MAG: hypothetical protein PVG93_01295 [Phycisphaerales bacterium]|jgi:hypothetical protein